MSPKRGKSPKRSGNKRPRNSQRSNRQSSNVGATVEVKLKAMAYGGSALGSANKRTVFVPYTIPGERVKAHIVRSERNVDFAEGDQLLSASADRVFPACPHFGPGQCWGCQWQHIDYNAQLLLKQDVLADQLARMGKFDDATLDRAMKPVVPAPDQWGYNHQMTFERSPDGYLGLARVDGRTIQAIEQCLVLHESLQALYESIDLDFPDLKSISLQLGSDGQTMIILSMTSEDAPHLEIDLATSVNVLLPDNEPVNLIGDTITRYEIGGREFRVTVGAAFRSNIRQIEPMIAEILRLLALDDNDNVLDLYAGTGVFSAFLALRAGLVTLVESYPPAVTDADENLADFDNVDIVEGSVEDVLTALIDAGETYTKAIVDPPGSGLSGDALAALLELNLERLVYVSSHPATLARDGRKLVENGYRLETVQPFDFAPQTYYIDCVALFVRDAN